MVHPYIRLEKGLISSGIAVRRDVANPRSLAMNRSSIGPMSFAGSRLADRLPMRNRLAVVCEYDFLAGFGALDKLEKRLSGFGPGYLHRRLISTNKSYNFLARI